MELDLVDYDSLFRDLEFIKGEVASRNIVDFDAERAFAALESLPATPDRVQIILDSLQAEQRRNDAAEGGAVGPGIFVVV